MGKRNLEVFAFGKLVAPAVTAVAIVSLATMNACTSSDQSTQGHEAMIQNAQDAEQAEAQLGQKPAVPEAKMAAKSEGKSHKNAQHKSEASAHSSGRAPASAAGGVFVVQIGAFKMKENAEKLQAKLKEAGYPVELHSIEHSKNGLLHLVRFAPTQNRSDAETLQRDLATKQEMHAQLLALPAAN